MPLAGGVGPSVDYIAAAHAPYAVDELAGARLLVSQEDPDKGRAVRVRLMGLALPDASAPRPMLAHAQMRDHRALPVPLTLRERTRVDAGRVGALPLPKANQASG